MRGRERARGAYSQESIFSGRTIEELASGKSRAEEIRAELEELQAPRKKVRAADVKLMLAETRDPPFTRPGWIFELKYDGYRLLAGRESGKHDASLPPRHGLDGDLSRDRPGGLGDFPSTRSCSTARSSFWTNATAALRAPAEARASPAPHRHRARSGRASGDLLRLRPPRLRGLRPARPAARNRARPSSSASSRARAPSATPTTSRRRARSSWPPRASSASKASSARRRTRRTARARSGDWIKVKLDRTGDFAVVGYTKPDGLAVRIRRAAPRAPGSDGDGSSIYAGRVGTGFSDKLLHEIHARLEKSVRPTPAFGGAVPTGRDHVWVEPELVAEVRFREWTGEGLLRHPAFLRLRDDKPIQECIREADPGSIDEPATPPPSPARPYEPEEKVVPFSNLTRSSGRPRAIPRATSSSTTAPSLPGSCPIWPTGPSS